MRADRRIGHDPSRAHVPYYRFAAVDAYADMDGHAAPAFPLRSQRSNRLLHLDRGSDRPHGVVRLLDRVPKEGHETIADELVHSAIMAKNDPGHRLEVLVEGAMYRVGLLRAAPGSEARDVAE